MFGSIFHMRPRAGHEAEVIALFEEWQRTRGPVVPGAIAGYLLRPENRPGELVGVAIFADRESYLANASDPRQDAWYRQLRERLEADPQWEDGEFLGGEPRM